MEHEQIDKLKTYAAIALYEICVRFKFKGKPTALTTVHDLEWWVEALTASPKKDEKTGKAKLRPWVKFKYDQGNRAIEEINEKTNIHIELIEHKGKGKTIVAAQFKVTHKDMSPQLVEGTPSPKMSPELAEMASSLNVDLKIIKNFISGGQSEVGLKAALSKLKTRSPGLAPIESMSGYLSKVLEEINLMIGHTPAPVMQSQQTILPKVVDEPVAILLMALTYKDERRALIREELRSLDSDEQRVYAYLALEDLRKSRMASASLTEKVEAGLWESAPVLFSKMVELFATEKYGSDWGVEKASEY